MFLVVEVISFRTHERGQKVKQFQNLFCVAAFKTGRTENFQIGITQPFQNV